MNEADSTVRSVGGRAAWLPQVIFFALFALALIRPFGRGDLYFPLSLAVMAGALFTFAYFRRAELVALGRWLSHRWPLALLLWLVLGVTFSMVVSVQREGVGEWSTLIQFVYSKYVVLALLPLLVLAFARRVAARPWGVFALILALQLLGFAAYLGADWAEALLSWSRGAEWHRSGGRVAGLFDNPTVYGAISALFVLFTPAWYLRYGRRAAVDGAGRWGRDAPRIVAVAVTLLSLVGVFASFSLTAMAAVAAGALAWLLNGTLRWRHGLAAVVVALVAVHLLGVFNATFSERIARNLPYFEDLYDGRTPTLERLRPKFRYDNHNNPFYWATHGRWDAWRNAVELWREQPLTGIGLGQFRLRSGGAARDENPHNLYIQVLAENGLISFVPLALLLLYLGWRSASTPWFGLFGGVAVMQMGNNFFDYSLPWVICIAWVGGYLVAELGGGAKGVEGDGYPAGGGSRILLDQQAGEGVADGGAALNEGEGR